MSKKNVEKKEKKKKSFLGRLISGAFKIALVLVAGIFVFYFFFDDDDDFDYISDQEIEAGNEHISFEDLMQIFFDYYGYYPDEENDSDYYYSNFYDESDYDDYDFSYNRDDYNNFYDNFDRYNDYSDYYNDVYNQYSDTSNRFSDDEKEAYDAYKKHYWGYDSEDKQDYQNDDYDSYDDYQKNKRDDDYSNKTNKKQDYKTEDKTPAKTAPATTPSTSGMTAQTVTSSSISKFVECAKSYLGTPYVWGGTSRSGVDCSGLVYLAAQEAGLGTLPRTAKTLYGIASRVEKNNMIEGDLVFFSSGSSISHVAIYVGNNQILHAVSEGSNTGVITSKLSQDYWKNHYYSSGRIMSNSVTEKRAQTRAQTRNR